MLIDLLESSEANGLMNIEMPDFKVKRKNFGSFF